MILTNNKSNKDLQFNLIINFLNYGGPIFHCNGQRQAFNQILVQHIENHLILPPLLDQILQLDFIWKKRHRIALPL